MKNVGKIKLLSVVLISFLFSCCVSDTPYYKDVVADYNNAKNKQISDEKNTVDNKVFCYLDYSRGVGEAMSLTADFNNAFANYLKGDQNNVQFFKIGENATPVPIQMGTSEASFSDINNYTDKGSMLHVAIDEAIKNKNSQSIFITDFERVDVPIIARNQGATFNRDHPISSDAWAQNQFKSWLALGNQIDIYCYPFNRPDAWFATGGPEINNNIYTIVFTPNELIKSDKSVINYLNDKSVVDSKFEHFKYNTSDIVVSSKIKTPEVGIVNENLAPLDLILNKGGENFEFYELASEDLTEFLYDDAYADKRIINSLTIENKIANFESVSFGVKVYDITSTLGELFLSKEPGQELILSEPNPETGKRDTIQSGQESTYTYSNGVEVNDVFVFIYNPDTKEAGVKLVDDFIGVESNRVFRIDFVIEDVTFKSLEQNEYKKLSLKYTGNEITSLPESLELALRDLATDLKGKILYTVYIQITA